MTERMKRDMFRWWRNLINGIEISIEMESNLTEESTIAELLELSKNKLEELKDDN